MSAWQRLKRWFGDDDIEHASALLADAEERIIRKTSLLRRERDALRKALAGLVAMHRGGPNAVGNWEHALEEADTALAIEREWKERTER